MGLNAIKMGIPADESWKLSHHTPLPLRYDLFPYAKHLNFIASLLIDRMGSTIRFIATNLCNFPDFVEQQFMHYTLTQHWLLNLACWKITLIICVISNLVHHLFCQTFYYNYRPQYLKLTIYLVLSLSKTDDFSLK